jgi:SAM-dependent methyltransferase
MSNTVDMVKYDTFCPEEIIAALYQAILKRDPDSTGFNAHVASLRRHGLLPIVQNFIGSEEFKRTNVGSPHGTYPDSPPGLKLNFSPRNEVQTRLSDDDKVTLWAHIQKVWTKFGHEEPYWSVLTDKKFLSDQMSRENLTESFYDSGSHDLTYFDAFLQRNDVEVPRDATIAEFGCGVARVTRFLARRYKRVLAFDISSSHVAAARKRLRNENIDNVEFVLLRGPEDLSKLQGVDIFFSLMVLQHNPPPIICAILEQAFQGLADGGIAFFQVPTYGLGYKFSLQDYYDGQYNRNEMEMHFVPQREIFQLFNRHTMSPIEVGSDHCIGNHDRWISNTFLARKRQ